MPSQNDPYDLSVGVPSVEVFRRLRTDAGLSDKAPEAVALALPRTWHGVILRHEGRPIGMGRVIGDGGTAFQIVDICVHPAHQGRGLGRRIMAALTEELERRAPATAYVSLIADGPARFLYEKFGFADTAAHGSIGMYRVMGGGPQGHGT
ncbi:GNAT family N-acetyltransferase [Streptomyces sp. LBUM 1478]|uniref:Putative acetyltransferase n=2 Tax=Streptomyces scabiei TaxID=1930 RepID=C9ZDX4_STRSW|nr:MULTISPECIES: GNAT family N-acetyltransferase [Streptomyces]MBP5867082.1 GNAT family N-acetyltransferase [Streptomyces sp. LBUM 1485]MBP5905677.1 GNAT family N-acetyltransferase [Streptomyces sp. LBUM 1478]MBP5931765.1 GNAT family N-acetyltransferase [Streptomyces sp. LBUM 1479]MBP5893944.1 GNAT family N-acetyltransferase [Streptomyces sp. LBUM 1481]MBP5917149.1 GNAT family N-acetyltransferase [Streptomyces sp. LBUM 1486]